ncbi:antibiotic biosynthesis monooxygenase [Saccharibacillus sp. CPCC 101409]|uniref:antibiotic biosynthesis monooxygenase family protein n=1 Tax=Saccharibacillus sp. CPCC 101409 TaxID=3058041 RepID=UPI0026729D75|nr:antibiotic biosynthesis monooxygenase [Saccharibacillus sp. CPCC 101409]MDO3412698.1 antibiotic biosynthesis monooxygenase [Saccharibacillus sp. CPCC 101409]
MFVYLFHGTLPEDPQLDNIHTLSGEDETLYLFEAVSPPDTSIDSRSAYQVIDSSGSLAGGCAVMNNIPVGEGGREAFEERFLGRARRVEEMPGFAGIRVLRPLQGDTYVILTVWKDEDSFKSWQSSEAYNHAHKKRESSEGLTQQRPEIFTRPSFVTVYRVTPPDPGQAGKC